MKDKYGKRKKLKNWTFMKYLIVALIGILAFNIATNTVKNAFEKEVEPIRYSEHHEGKIGESEYIISKEYILSKLQMKSQIVSMEQDFHKEEIHIDEGFFGDRITELRVNGTYLMGLNTQDIEVKHIDSSAKTVFIKLPTPVLISLDIPFDEIDFDKTQGFFRLAMDEAEQKNFYKSFKKNMAKEISNDEKILHQANLFNQEVIKDMLTSLTDIKNVIFE